MTLTDEYLDDLIMACLPVVFPGRQLEHLTDQELDELVEFSLVVQKLRELMTKAPGLCPPKKRGAHKTGA